MNLRIPEPLPFPVRPEGEVEIREAFEQTDAYDTAAMEWVRNEGWLLFEASETYGRAFDAWVEEDLR